MDFLKSSASEESEKENSDQEIYSYDFEYREYEKY